MGGDPLTLVTEMPLFLPPGVGSQLGPPGHELLRWRERLATWELALREAPGDLEVGTSVRKELTAAGLEPPDVEVQMRYQWAFISGGIELVEFLREDS